MKEKTSQDDASKAQEIKGQEKASKVYNPEKGTYDAIGFPPPYAEEIDLAELVAVLWRQRLFIAAVIAVIVAFAAMYCLLATPKYEIIAQIRPGITGYTQDGDEIRSWSPKEAVSQTILSSRLKSWKWLL